MYGTQRSPFLTALFNPVNLMMLGLAAAAGLCAAWWLFPIGLVLWLIMFLMIYRDPALQLNNMVEGRDSLAARFQPGFDRIQKTQVTLFNTLGTAPGAVRGALQPIQAAVNETVERAYQISARLSTLDNYVSVTHANRDPGKELSGLDQKVAAATDAHLRQEYEESRGTLRGQVDNLQQMSGQLERFEAELTSLAGVLEGVLADVVRLQALNPKNIRPEVPGLLQRIREQQRQLGEFDK